MTRRDGLKLLAYGFLCFGALVRFIQLPSDLFMPSFSAEHTIAAAAARCAEAGLAFVVVFAFASMLDLLRTSAWLGQPFNSPRRAGRASPGPTATGQSPTRYEKGT
jgi:hypothetical protein